jgi:uncharacterized protein YidB (DUF937 family)
VGGDGAEPPRQRGTVENRPWADLIGQLASKVGLSPDVATSKLTELLPTLVDKLTPEGKIPESGLLQKGLEFLRSNLPKS